MPREDLEWAIGEWRAKKRRDAYKLYRDYYDGRHRLSFSTKRFPSEFARFLERTRDNLCPAVIDSVADRLKVTGIGTSAVRRTRRVGRDGIRPRIRVRVTDPLGSHAWSIWRRNEMGQRAGEVHRDALTTGDGYALVWPDRRGLAAIWPQKPEEIVVEYSEEAPGEFARAARIWRQADGAYRVNLFYATHTERYVGRPRRAMGSVRASVDDLRPFEVDGLVRNRYGRIPIFHFSNKRLFAYGVSELVDVIPLQDGLNKSLHDLFVTSEFASFRQRWVTGYEVEVDEETGRPKNPPFLPGIDRIFVAEGSETTFGEFGETNLEQFLKVQEDLRGELARVSGTPLHYLFITRGDFPSGEAMKSAEARFSTRLGDRQESYGNRWESALTFALEIEKARAPRDFELSALWASATPRSEEEQARTLTVKKSIGVSRRVLLKEAGYSDDEIDEMMEEEPDAGSDPPADPDDD